MFDNWKTTLLGILLAVGNVVNHAVEIRAKDPTALPVTAGNLAGSAVIAALGALAKDHDK